MQHLKQDIISLLEQKGTEVSTADILNSVSKEYVKLKLEGKHNEARKIHRNSLYHLDMLVKEHILKVAKFGENGQKYFVINVSSGEALSFISSSKYRKQLEESLTLMPPIPIEGYEHQGIVLKLGNLTQRMNSVVVLCDKYSGDLVSVAKNLLFMVDDCICLENFTNEANKKSALSLLKKLDKESSPYGKKICLSINLSDVDKGRLLELVSQAISFQGITFVFGIDKQSLIEKSDLISGLLEIYAKQKMTIYIKNRDKFDLPYFIGNAGVYSFRQDEWNSMKDKPIFIACSQSTIIIDVKKFYDNYGFNFARFRELLMNVSKTFLSTNPIQRKKLRDYFKENIPNFHRDFLELSRNYIRLWNFGLLEPELEKEKVLEIIRKSKEKIDEFARVQDRIFNSCGMPIRFKLALNQASKKSGESLSSAKFEQMRIEGINPLIESIDERMQETSKISSYFDGGVHVAFKRVGKAKASKELFNEISFLVKQYNPAFFSYEMEGLEYG